MENNNEREDKQQNFENNENGEEGEEQLGINSQGEYEEQIEGDEEMEQEGEEQVQQQQSIEEGYEKGMDGGEEQVEEGHEEAIENIQEGAVEEAYEEQNGQNNKENIENNKKNRKINNKKRIELINKKLNSNNNKSKNNRNNNINSNENIIDKDTIEEKDNNININKRNDILSDIIGKIQELKIRKNNENLRINYNNMFDDLNKELSKGLDKLYNNKNKNNNNNIINNFNEEQKMNTQLFERKIVSNSKFKEIISLINDKEYNPNKNYKTFGRNDLINFMNEKIKNKNNFSNINLFVPKKNNLTNIFENKIFGNNFKKIRKDNKNYYISCIDGKAIVNGVRKDIPIISRFSHKNNKLIKNNNTCIFGDLNRASNNCSNNFGKSSRRNNSLNINKCLKKNEFNYDSFQNYKRFSRNSGDNDFSLNILKNNLSKENLSKNNNNYFLRELKFFK